MQPEKDQMKNKLVVNWFILTISGKLEINSCLFNVLFQTSIGKPDI